MKNTIVIIVLTQKSKIDIKREVLYNICNSAMCLLMMSECSLYVKIIQILKICDIFSGVISIDLSWFPKKKEE